MADIVDLLKPMEATVIQKAVTAAEHSSNLYFEGLGLVLVMVILAGAISVPILAIFRNFKKTSADASKSTAESVLFEQLQTQLRNNTEAILQLQAEKIEWFKKAMELKVEVDRLKVFEEMVNSMKARLEEKDRIIEARDTDNRQLMQSIIALKDRIHELEMRLNRDEQKFCEGCIFKKEAT
jgi:predicted RNase H-like nuclease (RuvC/YqgF family)